MYNLFKIVAKKSNIKGWNIILGNKFSNYPNI